MTPDDVKARLDEIQSRRHDDEVAHGLEDALWEDVLRAIADGTCTDPVECARIAVSSSEVCFSRWRA